MRSKIVSVERYEHTDFVWVADHYDFHLKGLCRFNKKLCVFITDQDSDPLLVTIVSMSVGSKLLYLIRKTLFELMVGTHWTYRDGKLPIRFRLRRPKWLWARIMKLYYRMNGLI